MTLLEELKALQADVGVELDPVGVKTASNNTPRMSEALYKLATHLRDTNRYPRISYDDIRLITEC